MCTVDVSRVELWVAVWECLKLVLQTQLLQARGELIGGGVSHVDMCARLWRGGKQSRLSGMGLRECAAALSEQAL